jgi:hypothetical protein
MICCIGHKWLVHHQRQFFFLINNLPALSPLDLVIDPIIKKQDMNK